MVGQACGRGHEFSGSHGVAQRCLYNIPASKTKRMLHILMVYFQGRGIGADHLTGQHWFDDLA